MRYGLTREFQMECGGKQGSRLTGRMFAKMMDVLTDELHGKGFKVNENLLIAVLLWVDDVVSCAVGVDAQKEILQVISDFAIKHKITWGQEKCKVMRVGKHKDTKKGQEWQAGDLSIQETDKYKYLGDIITSDGKNRENLYSRKAKLQCTTININTIAASEVMYQIETAVLLELHEKMNISSLINNAESWNLNKGEEQDIEKTEIQALKDLFDLPLHTPTPAIVFSFGVLFTKQRIDMKLLLYLHKVLNKSNESWIKMTLNTLKSFNAGWYKKIITTLEEYELPVDFDTVKNYSPGEWKNRTKSAIEKKNKDRLTNSCYKMEDQKGKQLL